MTDKHNTKYNTLITEQPYIHAWRLIFTFPGQNETRPGHGTPWVNSGTIPAIPGRLATLRETAAGKAQRYHTDPVINLYTTYHVIHDELTRKFYLKKFTDNVQTTYGTKQR